MHGDGSHACGRFRSSNTAKLVNQIIVAINNAAVVEGMSLAVKMGTEPKLVFDTIKGWLAGSTVINAKMLMILTRIFCRVSV